LVLETWTRLVAVLAIDRAITIGTEGHESGFAAVGTYRFEHLPGLTIVAALVLTLSAAIGATRRLVDETAAGVEFLLSCGENELRTTIATG